MNAGATAPEWAAGGGGGATTALDNLASVAINTSLLSDTDNTDDLGSALKAWKDGYFKGVLNVGAAHPNGVRFDSTTLIYGSGGNVTYYDGTGNLVRVGKMLDGVGKVVVSASGMFGWGDGDAAQPFSTAFYQNAAGVIEVNNGTANTYRDILTRGLRSNAVAFASAIGSPVEGTIQAFTDSSTATWGATITGGGANHVLGYFNGTNWTVMGK
jgi:hypothetical protein